MPTERRDLRSPEPRPVSFQGLEASNTLRGLVMLLGEGLCQHETSWLPGQCPHLPLPTSASPRHQVGTVLAARGSLLMEHAWTAFPSPAPTSLLLLSQGGKELFVFPVALIYGPLCSLSICTNSVK